MSIVDDVATKFGGKVYGEYVSICCPFHDDSSPSMLVFEDHYSCLACGAWGKDPSVLLGKVVLHVSKPNYQLYPDFISPENYEEYVDACSSVFSIYPFMQDYLLRRGISEESIRKYRLGFRKNWYTFPVVDEGKIISIIHRASPDIVDEVKTRYYNHGMPTCYAPDRQLLDSSDYVVVVFGTIDAVSLCSNGIPAITSSGGKSSFRAEWLDKYRKSIIVVPDVGEDDNGSKLSAKLGWRGRLVSLPLTGPKDPNDYISAGRLPELLDIIGVR